MHNEYKFRRRDHDLQAERGRRLNALFRKGKHNSPEHNAKLREAWKLRRLTPSPRKGQRLPEQWRSNCKIGRMVKFMKVPCFSCFIRGCLPLECERMNDFMDNLVSDLDGLNG